MSDEILLCQGCGVEHGAYHREDCPFGRGGRRRVDRLQCKIKPVQSDDEHPVMAVTHRIGPPAGTKKARGRGARTGFRDTYSHAVLLEDAAEMIKLHLPSIEDFQAQELAYDL